jgi:hypothetical protein
MLRVSKLLWLFVLVAPVALAQPMGGGTPGPAPAPVDPAGEGMPKLSGPQMIEQGRDYRKEIEVIKLGVHDQVEAAKKEKDVIRLNCLMDKETQLKVNANIMDQSLKTLQEAISNQDDGTRVHEYTRITIVHEKAKVLKTEADACVGAETSYVGPTKVTVETPSGLSDAVDQPPPAIPPFTVTDRPPPASVSQ